MMRAPEQTLSTGDTNAPTLVPTLGAQAEKEFDKNPACLRQFNAFTSTPTFGHVKDDLWGIQAPFTVFAEFTGPCKCADLEYRQYIRGHIVRDPDGEKEDRRDLLKSLPAGALLETYQEDGDGTARYGYRKNAAVERDDLTDRYLNGKGDVDQANGCKYEGADTPFANFRSKPGEVWDITLEFYGDILNKGTPIQRRFWKAINGRFKCE